MKTLLLFRESSLSFEKFRELMIEVFPTGVSFSFLKPDTIKHDEYKRSYSCVARDVMKEMVEKDDLDMLYLGAYKMPKEWAEIQYKQNKDKYFYGELCTYMSGVSNFSLFKGEDVIKKVRERFGYKMYIAENPTDTIRHKYGEDIQKNGGHSSNDQESAYKELYTFLCYTESGERLLERIFKWEKRK